MKGQGARGTVTPGFEGGQTPLTAARRRRRASATRSGSSTRSSTSTRSRRFDAGTDVDPGALRVATGLVAKRGLVKVLGRGELTKALTVKAHAFSTSGASRRSKAAGGTVEVIPPPWGDGRPPARREQRPDQPVG